MTRRLATLLELAPGQWVGDVASGPGVTARLLAAEYGVTVDGVDIAGPVIQRAQEAAATHTERHDEALARMIDQIEARLHLARMIFPQELSDARVDADAALGYIDVARR